MEVKLWPFQLRRCGQRTNQLLFIVAETAEADGFIYILIMAKEAAQRREHPISSTDSIGEKALLLAKNAERLLQQVRSADAVIEPSRKSPTERNVVVHPGSHNFERKRLCVIFN